MRKKKDLEAVDGVNGLIWEEKGRIQKEFDIQFQLLRIALKVDKKNKSYALTKKRDKRDQ